jgi:hypothetical protein
VVTPITDIWTEQVTSDETWSPATAPTTDWDS